VGKETGFWCWSPISYNTEVKEWVELILIISLWAFKDCYREQFNFTFIFMLPSSLWSLSATLYPTMITYIFYMIGIQLLLHTPSNLGNDCFVQHNAVLFFIKMSASIKFYMFRNLRVIIKHEWIKCQSNTLNCFFGGEYGRYIFLRNLSTTIIDLPLYKH
jgi:hypothetical protein